METFKPIAMRCTQQQFEEIKPKLKGLRICDVDFDAYMRGSYLTNNLAAKECVISNIAEYSKRDYSREVYEEWNERIFLEACGIEVETLQEKEQRLLKELEEVRKEMEESEPKVGDWCKFWDSYKNSFTVGVLKEIVQDMPVYRFKTAETKRFKNCEKITDSSLLESLNRLFKN